MKYLLSLYAALAICLSASAAVSINQSAGWLESAWAEFTMTGYDSCAVYVKAAGASTETALDKELIRRYTDHWRVDALGLSAGSYTLKIVPYNTQGQAVTADQAVTPSLTVQQHDRNGFAHINRGSNTVGIGAYNDNGTLKTGARVLYVTATNCKTIQLSMKVDTKGNEELRTGLQHILQAYEKGVETRPLAVRIIGCIPAAALDSMGSSEEGLQVKGKSDYQPIYLTMEGVGNDAAIHGFGILNRSVAYVEYRNFASLNCMDDCLGFDTKNGNCWVHNMDFFYGQAGGDADQAKGDGTVDIKAQSKNITVSYNHFFDSGKSSLCGMKSETTDCYITYHHNWFDHSDSRHPRIRTMSVHVYNNYYDGNSKYGVGVTTGSSAFVEANYFRNCKHPMLSSGQGTDAQGDGTFSGETGGIIKAYSNYTSSGCGSVIYRSATSSIASFDAYQVSHRQDTVPAQVVTVSGGTCYNNFDKQILSLITPDAANQVPTIVMGTYGAGRCQKGNISYNFSAAEDDNSSVIPALKDTVNNYATSNKAKALQYVLGIGATAFEPEPDPEPQPGQGGWELYWDNTTGKWSTTQFTISGNNTKKTQTITLLDGTSVEVAYALKMESATSVKFTAPSNCTLKIIFQSDQTGSIKIDDVKKTSTTNVMTESILAGAHTLTKGDSRNVFYIALVGLPTGYENVHSSAIQAQKLIRDGRLLIIRNGKAYDSLGRLVR